ncbi:MAG: S49 family peptidase [Gammaproteobacteria bacterium]|nr:S49 family peptidase [Gammaproteobacteria bacterium]
MNEKDELEKETDNREPGKWERELVRKLAFSSLNEQRRARRWGIFFKFLTFSYLLALLVIWMPDVFPDASLTPSSEHTAVVELKGVISAETDASADNVISSLRNAFEDSNTKGVILRINSPGGSPVQSGYINDEIGRLREKYPDIPFYAVVTDICASGGYYIAVAADKIYVDKASIVGSIGVLMNGFGFVEGMEKLGVERRLLTSGAHKGIMDPFSPVDKFDQAHMQALLSRIHQQFIDAVKEGRGERLKQDDQIFSGLFWTGEESIKLGLADELGSSSYVAREVIGAEEIVEFSTKKDLLERFAKRVGAGVAASLSTMWGIQGGYQFR